MTARVEGGEGNVLTGLIGVSDDGDAFMGRGDGEHESVLHGVGILANERPKHKG